MGRRCAASRTPSNGMGSNPRSPRRPHPQGCRPYGLVGPTGSSVHRNATPPGQEETVLRTRGGARCAFRFHGTLRGQGFGGWRSGESEEKKPQIRFGTAVTADSRRVGTLSPLGEWVRAGGAWKGESRSFSLEQAERLKA